MGLGAEGEFRGALREYREGLGSRAGEFEGLRFDPFDEEVRGALGRVDGALRGCSYVGGMRWGVGSGGLPGMGGVPCPCFSIMCGVLGAQGWSC